jgi:hypothetical protein
MSAELVEWWRRRRTQITRSRVMGGCKSWCCFFGGFFCFWEKRTRDFAFVSLCYERSWEEMCTGYAMAASGRMQYDYKQTNKQQHFWSIFVQLVSSASLVYESTTVFTYLSMFILTRYM